ncbi:MAG: fibrinogen-like YCDxxxxGGGW domain-containing protein [Myxococcales bacterium]
MKPLLALLASLFAVLAVLACVEVPKDALFRCDRQDDCRSDEYCSPEKTCLPRPDAGERDGGGPVPDAGRPDAGGPPDADAPPDAQGAADATPVPRDASHPELLDAGPPLRPDAAFFPSSCKELRQNSPQPLDGIETLYFPDPTGGLTKVAAYCLQSVQGGGWTLVARTASSTISNTVPFGWFQSTGALDDLTRPYCLGALTRGLSFAELPGDEPEDQLRHRLRGPAGPGPLRGAAGSWMGPAQRGCGQLESH